MIALYRNQKSILLIVLLVKFNLIIINKEEFIYAKMPAAGVVWG